jgi:pyruvate/2-oxoglutarate dehydrogenase complex dihydrolipoamide acyltransferase (E2) component
MELELPRLADTLVEGTVTRWFKKAGERVREGEALVEIETDKVNSELAAPADGVLAEILVPEGETVPVGRLLARISTTGEQPVAPPPAGVGPTAAAPRSDRLAEHLRQSAAAVPQGACVREVAATGLERMPQALRTAAGGRLEVATLPPSRSHLPIPALRPGQAALVAPGAERGGRRLLTLCYDRRVLDDWAADQLLGRIAAELGG